MNYKLIHLILILLLLFITGCSAPPKILPSALRYQDGQYKATISLSDPELSQLIEFQAPRFRKQGRFTQSVVNLHYQGTQPISLEYYVEWTDSSGFPIDTVSQWKPFQLSPNQYRQITSVGKAEDAEGVHFRFRR